MGGEIDLADPNPDTQLSPPILVAGAKSVIIELAGVGIVTRELVLSVSVSCDGGTNFRPYNMILSNAANTNGQNPTRVASITRDATGVDVAWLSPETLGAITHIQATMVLTDSGTPEGIFSINVNIQY